MTLQEGGKPAQKRQQDCGSAPRHNKCWGPRAWAAAQASLVRRMGVCRVEGRGAAPGGSCPGRARAWRGCWARRCAGSPCYRARPRARPRRTRARPSLSPRAGCWSAAAPWPPPPWQLAILSESNVTLHKELSNSVHETMSTLSSPCYYEACDDAEPAWSGQKEAITQQGCLNCAALQAKHYPDARAAVAQRADTRSHKAMPHSTAVAQRADTRSHKAMPHSKAKVLGTIRRWVSPVIGQRQCSGLTYGGAAVRAAGRGGGHAQRLAARVARERLRVGQHAGLVTGALAPGALLRSRQQRLLGCAAAGAEGPARHAQLWHEDAHISILSHTTMQDCLFPHWTM